MDVFRGQMTNAVFEKLKKNDIVASLIPADMTHLFLPLDLTVSGYFKQCVKQKFTECYSNEVMQRLLDGEKLKSIKVKSKLSTTKPLHAKWLMEAYEYMTTVTGREICLKGCLKSGTSKAIENGSNDIFILDLFFEIDPIENEMRQDQVDSFDGSIKTTYITDNLESDSDGE